MDAKLTYPSGRCSAGRGETACEVDGDRGSILLRTIAFRQHPVFIPAGLHGFLARVPANAHAGRRWAPALVVAGGAAELPAKLGSCPDCCTGRGHARRHGVPILLISALSSPGAVAEQRPGRGEQHTADDRAQHEQAPRTDDRPGRPRSASHRRRRSAPAGRSRGAGPALVIQQSTAPPRIGQESARNRPGISQGSARNRLGVEGRVRGLRAPARRRAVRVGPGDVREQAGGGRLLLLLGILLALRHGRPRESAGRLQ